MEDKKKFIFLGLSGVILIVFFLIALLALNAKQAVERERNDLKKENITLAAKINETSLENQRLRDKVSLLDRDLNSISQEKDEIQKKYELIDKEREDLAEQVKSLKAQLQKASVHIAPAAPTPTMAAPEDTYWAGILKAKKDLEVQLENIRNDLKSSQIKNDELQRAKATIELEVNSLAQETQDLKQQIEYNQKIVDGLAQELVREKEDKFRIQNTLKSVKNENALLKQQLGFLNNKKFDLEKKILDMQKENVTLQDKVKSTELNLKDKMLQINKFKGVLEGMQMEEGTAEPSKAQVELPPIVVRPQVESAQPQAATIAPVNLAAKVLAVNKENKFVIVDLGEDKGAKLGQTFKVFKKDELIATLEVIQVRKDISACDIKNQTKEISVGDTVK